MPGLADVAELVVLLKLKDEVSGGLKNINKNLTTLHGSSQKVNASYKIGQGIGLGIRNTALLAGAGFAFLGTQVFEGLQQLEKLDAVTAQTNAVIKSTGGVAGISAEQVRALAQKYEDLNAVIDDKVIQSAENVLLTFPKIGKTAFEPTLLAALDMNTALGGDESSLQARLIAVGKAVNDPIKGITALRRVGVAFTADQEKEIKALVKKGDVLGAQKVILAELQKEFGGSFVTQGKTATGAIAAVGDAIEDLQMALAEGFLPILKEALPTLTKALRDPAFVTTIRGIGANLASMFSKENIQSAIGFAQTVIPAIIRGLNLAVDAAKTFIGLFNSLPEPVKALLVGGVIVHKLTGGLVTEGIGDLIKGPLSQFFGRGSPANPMFVYAVNGGLGGPGGGLPGAAGGGAGFLASLGGGSALAGGAIATGAIAAGVAAGLAQNQGNQILHDNGIKGSVDLNPLNPLGGPIATLATAVEVLGRGIGVWGRRNETPVLDSPDQAPGTTQPGDTRSELRGIRNAVKKADTHNETRAIAIATRGVKSSLGDTRSELRRIQIASRSNVVATRQATEAIKDKDLSVTVPVTLTTAVSVHLSALSRNEAIVQRLNGRASSVR